jgi:hypothetical protein
MFAAWTRSAKRRIVALTGAAMIGWGAPTAVADGPGANLEEPGAEYVISDPFESDAASPIAFAAQPEQLTSPAQAPQVRAPQPRSSQRPSQFTGARGSPQFVSAPRSRLARTPDMFGDFFGRGATLTGTELLATVAPFTITGRADLALAGGTRGLLIGEHNKALPVDRAYVTYNHYHNALKFRAVGTDPIPAPGVPFDTARDVSLDRFTFGLEKTLLSGWTSLEVRMPLTGGYDFGFASTSPTGIVTAEGGEVGNVSLISKVMLYQEGCCAASAGLGLEAPTGSDAEARIASINYTIENEAVHLHPYFAVLSRSEDDWFVHAFAQLDVPLNGNSVSFASAVGPPAAGSLGEYVEQMLLHFNFSLGHWLYRDPCAPLLTGLAGIVEWHYITALEDTDVVAATLPAGFPPGATIDLRNRQNRFDVFNVTTGIHTEIACDTTFRVGAVFPLLDGDDRFFDAEIVAQLSRRF